MYLSAKKSKLMKQKSKESVKFNQAPGAFEITKIHSQQESHSTAYRSRSAYCYEKKVVNMLWTGIEAKDFTTVEGEANVRPYLLLF